jgi:AcrR family transcriptional regulator
VQDNERTTGEVEVIGPAARRNGEGGVAVEERIDGPGGTVAPVDLAARGLADGWAAAAAAASGPAMEGVLPDEPVVGWRPESGDEAAEHTAATRRGLLEAATEVFLALGTAGATLADVACHAGTTLAAVEDYFGSHHELMNALAEHLYVRSFRSYPPRHDAGGLGAFLTAYLDGQSRPETRLIWRLGDALTYESPEGPDTALWHLIAEIEKRLIDDGTVPDAAHSRALVLAPALMLIARRAAFDLATDTEMENFVVAACHCANTSA